MRKAVVLIQKVLLIITRYRGDTTVLTTQLMPCSMATFSSVALNIRIVFVYADALGGWIVTIPLLYLQAVPTVLY